MKSHDQIDEAAAFGIFVESVVDYAIFILTPAGEVASWNQGAERIKGYSATEILGRPVSVFYTPEEAAAGKPESDLEAARAGGRCETEGWRLRKSGERFWANAVITALRDPEGRLRGFVKVTRDLTERKLAQEQSRTGGERFRMVVEAAPNAMIMVDKEGKIVLVNSQTEKLFGYPRNELLGRRIEVLVPERFRGKHPGHRHDFFAAPQTRAMGAGRDLYGLHKEGREVPVEIGLNPIKTPEGAFVLASIIDITERKQSETLRAAKEAAEAVNREMEAFNYSVAHDLRAPLRKIAGFTELLEENLSGSLDAANRDYMKRVQSNVHQMDGIIDGLLKLARVLQQEPKRVAVDLSGLVQGIAGDLLKSQPERRVEFVIPPGITAEGDPEFLQIILRNLLENSWKFTSKHPRARIEFSAALRGEETVFCVRDDGAGFDMTHADKLFGAFKRLHAPGSFPGAGIGLATVLRALRRHRGRIWAEAEVERGAAFFFTLG